MAEKVSVGPEPSWLYKINTSLAKKPEAKSISNGYYLELVDNQTNLQQQTAYTHFIRHIVNESGVQNASEISVTFSPEYQQVIFHKVMVIRDGKTVNAFSSSQIKVVQEETEAGDFQYNGLKRAYIVLSDVRKGDRIETSYSLVGFNPVFANRFSESIYFSAGTATLNYFETIFSPQGRKLNIDFFNGASRPARTITGTTAVYHWSNPFLKPYESQQGVAPWFDNYPHVSISEYNNWKEVADWGLSLFKHYQYNISSSLKNKIASWRKEAGGDKDIFTTLATQFVQDQVRYLGLEIGDHTHKPHEPVDVYDRRYGDCKDKALLLAMILRQEGIPAFVALANTQARDALITKQPSPDAFNHAIVAVEHPSGYQFIDATIASQRGILAERYIPAYGYVLVLRDGSVQPEKVIPGAKKSATVIETLSVAKDNTEASRLEVLSTFAGGAADNMRSSIAGNSISDLEESYRSYYAKNYDSIRVDSDLVVTDDSVNNIFRTKETYLIPGLWHTDDKDKKSFEVFARPIFEQLPNPATSYKSGPLAIVYPQNIHYTLVVNMPSDWSFPVEEYHIHNEFYRFDYKSILKGNTITLDYYFITLKDNIGEDGRSRYSEDYKKIVSLLDFELSLKGRGNKDTQGSGGINWAGLFFVVLFATAFVLLFFFLNRQGADVLYNDDYVRPLGGWLIVIGIGLVVSLLYSAIFFFREDIFSIERWNTLAQSGGTGLQFLSLLETFLSLFWLTGGIALLYWFLKRRDIFPKMFIGYAIGVMASHLILFMGYTFVPYPSSLGDLSMSALGQFVRSCVYSAIWISYLLRSERVKKTFLHVYHGKRPGDGM